MTVAYGPDGATPIAKVPLAAGGVPRRRVGVAPSTTADTRGVRTFGAGVVLAVVGVAVVRGIRARRRSELRGRAVPPAGNGALILNPRSGGGTADRLGLATECRARGIEVLILEPGQDLAGLAEAAVARGADVLGMAGGDGSMGLVAGVAARHGVPMVVVPAGTRNHLAMDLGLDRGNVLAALDAFGAAVERRIDLGQVNGRVFVNNVSLGLYAQIVRSPEYRDAKADTTLRMLPDMLGPASQPFDLRFTGPAGERYTRAHVVQVSNNPYGRTPATLANRPRLDGGHLGVIAVKLPDDPAEARRQLAAARGHPERFPGSVTWEPSTFEVDSGGPIDVGMDGEALRLAAPLRFTIRPGALRIRVPRAETPPSPQTRQRRVLSTLRDLPRRARPLMGTPAAAGERAGRNSHDPLR
ncbi:diacylglycerol kinase family enzyme [Pseudarthrobacter oxydans]|uniref:diacylglycerol/lipid kinase family protein n=1 Tax=Pseudarthrobacter oxydans TaxID=1671 RepID=UPI0027848A0C|nr:diacylglycerol kinase family protein [Pseudarthrobacter oxydans]MDP9984769.1 diacylglycerol kinase family enzyme [Pseudarthrobacter oxydans]